MYAVLQPYMQALRMALVYCTRCGHKISTSAPRCPGCGEARYRDSPAQASPPEPGAQAQPSSSIRVAELKEVGAVTALSVAGLVFGLLGMLVSFVPLVGAYALYVGAPAALVSAIALSIAYSETARRTLAIVALTISLIGVVVSLVQYPVIVWLRSRAQNEVLNEARRTKAQADVAELKTALDRFYLDNGFYPSTAQGLNALVTRPTIPPTPPNYASGGYIEQVPKDPWGHLYFYASDGHSYELKPFGANGIGGGQGKNADIDGSSS